MNMKFKILYNNPNKTLHFEEEVCNNVSILSFIN